MHIVCFFGAMAHVTFFFFSVFAQDLLLLCFDIDWRISGLHSNGVFFFSVVRVAKENMFMYDC